MKCMYPRLQHLIRTTRLAKAKGFFSLLSYKIAQKSYPATRSEALLLRRGVLIETQPQLFNRTFCLDSGCVHLHGVQKIRNLL